MGQRFRLIMLFLSGGFTGIQGSIEFVPEADLSVDLGYYFFHKSKAFRQLYMFESQWDAYLTLFSVNKKFSFHFDPKIIAGQSRSKYGLVFHPEDISYGLITYGKYKTKYGSCILGLDHSCFHCVDTLRHLPYYWNKLMAGARSENFRGTAFISGILDGTDVSIKNRIAWSFMWSWYIREFFNIVEKAKIMTPDVDNYHDFEFRVKGAVYFRKNFVLSVNGLTLLGVGINGDFYGRQVLGLDADFKYRDFITSVYMVYYFDKNWFDSRDRLFEIGVKFEK
ncbi:MAG: hypothetical protein JW915_00390 [Chitinispirillaceae bacterium]|nr:hypothetical protein [Chitinispirillaceae bacterium]